MRAIQEINRHGRPKVWSKIHLPVWGHCCRCDKPGWMFGGICWDCCNSDMRKRYGMTKLYEERDGPK